MALVVEDGTGKSDAEAYVSVVDFKLFCDGLGYDYSAKTDTEIEQAIRSGAVYLEGDVTWVTGQKGSADQALSWPRTGAIDKDGYSISSATVPQAVIDANSQLAFDSFSGDLQPADTPDIGSLKAGPIEIKFDSNDSGRTYYRKAMSMLAGLIGSTLQGSVSRA